MRINEHRIGQIATITPSGRLRGWKAADIIDDCLRRQADSGARVVVVDASRLHSVDSLGLDALIRGCQALRDTGATMRMAGLTRRLQDLVVITRLSMLCDTYDTVSDATDGPGAAAANFADAAPRRAVYTVHA
jgi:anti-sigma B factor antagonist